MECSAAELDMIVECFEEKELVEVLESSRSSFVVLLTSRGGLVLSKDYEVLVLVGK